MVIVCLDVQGKSLNNGQSVTIVEGNGSFDVSFVVSRAMRVFKLDMFAGKSTKAKEVWYEVERRIETRENNGRNLRKFIRVLRQ